MDVAFAWLSCVYYYSLLLMSRRVGSDYHSPCQKPLLPDTEQTDSKKGPIPQTIHHNPIPSIPQKIHTEHSRLAPKSSVSVDLSADPFPSKSRQEADQRGRPKEEGI